MNGHTHDGIAADLEWHRLMKTVRKTGELRRDRTGVGTIALFGLHASWDLREGFPAITTKKLGFAQVRSELAAFLAGAETLEEFHAHGCNIWDANAKASYWKPRFEGDVGRIYGVQWKRWRSWSGEPGNLWHRQADQIEALVDGLRKDPHGRRHLVTAWNPGELGEMCLPPCHVLFQCFASDHEGHWLDLQFHMRSLDLFVGMPFDIASYGLLLSILARATDRQPRRLLMTVGDGHLYHNHVEQVDAALAREPMRPPQLELSMDCSGPFDFLNLHARLINYESHSALPAPMNV